MKSRLADPKIFMAMKNLPLSARTTIEGFLSGLHKSNRKGEGMEFSQYRSYEPGDDLRRLDWKLFARSDRYYVRESETETNISVRLLIDASASMNHEDSGFVKIEYVCYLAASLAYLALQQGDATSLYWLQNNKLFSLPPRNDLQHFDRICYQLENIQPAGQFTEPIHYKNLFANHKKELLIFITDYYQQSDEMTTLLKSLSAAKHEIIVLHIMGENETRLDFAGYTTLEDWETGQTVTIDAAADGKLYQQKLDAYITGIKTQLLHHNIWYELITMNQPLDKALQQFLHTRNKILR